MDTFRAYYCFVVTVLAPVAVLLELVLLDPVLGEMPPEVPPEALAAEVRPVVLAAEAALMPPEGLLQLMPKAVLVKPADP